MRKVLDQSHPFQAAKSNTVYRLVDEDGEFKIEKVTTSTSVIVEIPDGADPEQIFTEFVREKRANKSRSKRRISVEDALVRHYVLGHSWQKIADDVGQRSVSSISQRVNDHINTLARRYLQGEAISSLVGDLDISENHLHDILSKALERMRERLLYDYKSGQVMRTFASDVVEIASITNFLDDWDSFEYQIVSPFCQEMPQLPAGKKVLYSEEFYEIRRESGKVFRVTANSMEGLTTYNWNSSEMVEAFGLIEVDPVVEVRDMFGNRSEHYTQALRMPL